MPSSHPLPASCQCFTALVTALDPRSAPRLAWLLAGAVLARGRQTVTSWIRAAGLSTEFRPCYTTVSAAGKSADSIAARLVHEVVKPLATGAGQLTFALDDTPTERYGRKVQGGPASTTTRRLGRRVGRSCTGTCGWSSGYSPATRSGASSPSRSWPGCTFAKRTCPASPRGTGMRSCHNCLISSCQGHRVVHRTHFDDL